jgi:hypothetical protein
MSAAAAALATRKLRVSWDAPAVDGAPDRAALLDGIWAALRQRHAAPAIAQDEQVEVLAITADAPGTFRVALRYTFDHDYASQYDRRDTFAVELVVDHAGALLAVAGWRPLGDC